MLIRLFRSIRHFTRALAFILLTGVLVAGAASRAAAQTPTPQYNVAEQQLIAYLGLPAGSALPLGSTWSFTIDRFADSALGCPFIAGSPQAGDIAGYLYTFIVNGVSYDVRVSESTSIAVVCAPPETGLSATGVPLGTLAPAGTTAPVFTPCPANFTGFLPTRLGVGATGTVPLGSTPSRIRTAPSIDAVQVGVINPNTTFTIIAGPSCDPVSGLVWWQVRYGGLTGWSAEGVLPDEYFLEPVGPVQTPTNPAAVSGGPVPVATLAPERSAIAPANAAGLVPLTRVPGTEMLGGVFAVAFSPFGDVVSAASQNGIYSYALPNLAPSLTQSAIAVGAAALDYAASTGALVYRTRAGEVAGWVGSAVRPLPGHTAGLLDPNAGPDTLAISPDGTRLAFAATTAAGTPGLALADAVRGGTVGEIATDGPVRFAAYSPSGLLLAYGDSTLRIIDAAGREVVNTPLPIGGQFAWRPRTDGGEAWAWGNEEALGLYALGNAAPVQLYDTAQDDLGANEVALLRFSPDGALLLVALRTIDPADAPGPVRVLVFDAESADLLHTLDLPPTSDLAFSPDGTLLAAAYADGVVLYGVP